MNPATARDTADLIIGSGADQYDWYQGSESAHVWDESGNAFDDWHVTYLMIDADDPNTEPVRRVDFDHRVVMKWARYVLANPVKMLRTTTGTEYPAWSDALERECRHLVFNVQECDFDASSADELIQLAAYGEVVFG